MALSAVTIVLRKLSDVALKKALELYNVSDRIEPMRMELNLITGFLKDADAKCNKNPLVKRWVNELRDLAYRIEDALDTFLVDVEGNKHPSSSLMGKLKRVLKHPVKVNDLCDEIKKITKFLKTLYERGTQLGIKDIKEENQLIPTHFKPAKPSDIVDSEVVGLDSEKDQIISHLLDTTILRRTVLSIVGTGGLGKTTLAHKVYKSIQFNRQFDYVAWLSISQKWDETNLWRQILCSIKQNNPPDANEALLMELNRSLSGKRYLIILDDVWTVNLWERLRIALPDENNASRVLITTRNLDVAMAADCNTPPFKPNYLNDDESLALLFRKALQQQIQPDNYPPDLKNIAKQLIKKCGGLPLAIIVLGGILSRRARNSAAWQEVENTLDWHDKDGENCSKILGLSYEDLPYEVKPCFLYFASFPEDYEISTNHVTRMWVAEGFIPNDGAGTMEDQAKDCLAELVQRCLIHVSKISSTGRCKHCKMHDLLRDLAIHEAKNDNFLTVFSKAAKNRRQVWTRRAALQFCTSTRNDLSSKTVRSLICFGKPVLNWREFTLLRVLNFDGKDSTVSIARYDWLMHLINLRFLGFKHCDSNFGFQRVSFGHLKNLETLDLTRSEIELDDSLWKVPTLRNVISTYSIHGPSQWDHLKDIQTLKWVMLEKVPVFTDNINLRKIGVVVVDPDELETSLRQRQHVKGGSNLNNPPLAAESMVEKNVWHVLKGLLKWTKCLTSLSVRIRSRNLMFGLNGTHDLPDKLHKLSLGGLWAIALNVEMLPTNLVKFTLVGSMLKEDPMPILERLQSLRMLQLLEDSYTGTKLICSAEGFPSLEKLKLYNLPKLSEWEIKERAMPILNYLEITNCSLHTLPNLQNVPRLQELVVGRSVDLKKRMRSEDRYKIEHISVVRIL